MIHTPSLLDSANLKQHVTFPTHIANHTLDLVITHADSKLKPDITFSPVSPSDHFPILSSLTISPLPPLPLVTKTYRCFRSINVDHFKFDLLRSGLITHPPSNLSDLINAYNTTLAAILDKHAPQKTKTVRPKPSAPWFTSALSKLKSTRRHLELIWKRSHSAVDLRLLRQATNHYHAAIITAKRLYNASRISSNLSNPRLLWKSVNHLLHRNATLLLPTSFNSKTLPETFANFFFDKIKNCISLFSLNLKILLLLNLHLLSLLPFLKSFLVLVLSLLLNFLNLYSILMIHFVTLILFQPLFLKNVFLFFYLL